MCIRDRAAPDPIVRPDPGPAAGGDDRAISAVSGADSGGANAVSYTHLTLPTSDLV